MKTITLKHYRDSEPIVGGEIYIKGSSASIMIDARRDVRIRSITMAISDNSPTYVFIWSKLNQTCFIKNVVGEFPERNDKSVQSGLGNSRDIILNDNVRGLNLLVRAGSELNIDLEFTVRIDDALLAVDSYFQTSLTITYE